MASEIPRPPASDYGSDLGEDDVEHLLSLHQQLVTESIDEPLLQPNADVSHAPWPLARMARSTPGSQAEQLRDPSRASAAIEVEYDETNRPAGYAVRREQDPEWATVDQEQSVPLESEEPDTRTPIARFRTRPKKPLSVTDIVSPAWCELQYWYSLTKYGRVRRTPAMQQGSGVHKVLEDQVHTHVPVEVVSKEDRFGLRIWNIIHGLRTLRRTGLTRELEVWGLLDGEVVNGIIDEVTTKCPDEAAEAIILETIQGVKDGIDGGRKSKPLLAGQRTLTDFLTNIPSSSILENNSTSWLGSLQQKSHTIYLVDIKTRQSKSLPSAPSQLKSVQMQLMLYHRFFSALAANEVPASQIFDRYGVQPEECFSDTFLAQMGTLEMNSSPFPPDSEVNDIGPPQDPIDEILAHNTLSSLWQLLVSEFALVAPAHSISPLLSVEYRTPTSGSILGHRNFAFDVQQLEAYVSDEMKWWKGERAVKGVEIEEAYKCRICEFAPNCQWRIGRVEEGVRKARLKKESSQRGEM